MKKILLVLFILLISCGMATAEEDTNPYIVGQPVASGGVETLRVDGGGSTNWLTYDSASYPAHNTYVGDNDDDTYLYTTSSSTAERHSLADTSAGEGIASVNFCVRIKSSDGTSELRIYCTNGGVTDNGDYFAVANTWTTYKREITIDPDSTDSWTQATLNTAEIGVRSSTITGTLYLADMWIEITR